MQQDAAQLDREATCGGRLTGSCESQQEQEQEQEQDEDEQDERDSSKNAISKKAKPADAPYDNHVSHTTKDAAGRSKCRFLSLLRIVAQSFSPLPSWVGRGR